LLSLLEETIKGHQFKNELRLAQKGTLRFKSSYSGCILYQTAQQKREVVMEPSAEHKKWSTTYPEFL
jgi:Tat protein secretion system quality control protein TatD with DNase activity